MIASSLWSVFVGILVEKLMVYTAIAALNPAFSIESADSDQMLII